MLFKALSGSSWNEGVGYDYQRNIGMFEPEFDITHSTRPSNWLSATTLNSWVYPGTYLNTLPSSYTTLATQYFDNGNENIWHRDKRTRDIEVVSGDGWHLQMDNKLPEELREGKTYRIPKMEYHRVIKGTNELVLKIKEYSDDNI